MNKKSWWSAAVSGALLLICGCQADIHYQAGAVERARRFLLHEAVRELDLEQQSFVRYSDPVLLHAPCLGTSGRSADGNLKSELRQICVVWEVPGKDELFMVFGVSTPRMSDWYPNRLVKKRFRKGRSGIGTLTAQAVKFARLNMMDKLSVAEMNQIRFAMPALVESSFPVKFDDPGKKNAAAKAQYALVWQLGDRSAVFAGRAVDGNLKTWQCEAAGFYSAEETAKYTRKVLASPEAAFDYELPTGKKQPAAGK